MSFLGGALNQLSASDRVKASLIADLELRRKDARLAERFRAYHYKGSVDLLLQHGRFYPGRALPEEFARYRGRPNGCYGNALEAAKADPRLRYCEGVYTTGFGSPRSHGWCIAPDGGMLELTMPTAPEELTGRRAEDTHLPFLSPDHWGYFGVIFDVAFVHAHWDDQNRGLPLFDRPPAEIDHSQRHDHNAQTGLDFTSEPSDFPVLKVPYDPNRKEIPNAQN
jgi:hypothetical protein